MAALPRGTPPSHPTMVTTLRGYAVETLMTAVRLSAGELLVLPKRTEAVVLCKIMLGQSHRSLGAR